MQLFFLYYELRPKAGTDNFEQVGGAFVSCWIAAIDDVRARQIALADISEQGFEAISLEECRIAHREDFEKDPKGAEHYERAEEDGVSYLYHAWPPGPQEDDPIH